MTAAPIITIATWTLAHAGLPDADTDVLLYVEGDPEAQLGAYMGEQHSLFEHPTPLWVDAQGEAIAGRVLMWAPMPQPQWAAGLALMSDHEQSPPLVPAAGATFQPTPRINL